jgi:hypothetical protein
MRHQHLAVISSSVAGGDLPNQQEDTRLQEGSSKRTRRTALSWCGGHSMNCLKRLGDLRKGTV